MSKSRKRTPPANSRKTGARERALANLQKGVRYRFVPGVSGNPSGRPATAIFSKACREKLAQIVPGDPLKRTHAQYFCDLLAHQALHGDRGAIVEIADRAEGRPRVSVDFGERPDPLTDLLKAVEKMSERDEPLPEDKRIRESIQ